MKISTSLVGAFVMSGLALVVAIILIFGGTQFFTPTVRAVIYFQGSVANLAIGAPVTFRGVKIGSVTSIAVTFDLADLTAQIPVYVDLNPTQITLANGKGGKSKAEFDRLLQAGLRAQLVMQSLITGQLLINLDLQPGTVGRLVGGQDKDPEIPSVPSRLQTIEADIAELPLKDMVNNANQSLAAIRAMADSLTPRIAPLADNLKQTLDVMHLTLEHIDQLALAGNQQLSTNGDQLARTLISADATLRDADRLVAGLTAMTADGSPLRSDLQATMRDMAASASSLRSFTHTIERDPGSLLSGGVSP